MPSMKELQNVESGAISIHSLGKEQDLTSEAAKIYYKHLKEDIVSGYNGG